MTYKVVILSRRAGNLIRCVRSLQAKEPDLPLDHIIVVDDGAREEAEEQLQGIQWVPGVSPFIFARNANLGIRAAGSDVILLNDDAQLLTPGGLSGMAYQMEVHPAVGICSAAIQGVVGNRRQLADNRGGFRLEEEMLVFICVYLPSAVYQLLGPLDERFTGYGCDDRDYSMRALQAGLKLAIWDGCIVDHDDPPTSTFRTRPELQSLFQKNKKLLQDKWQNHQQIKPASVDLLYLAWNRLAFTQETFSTMVANTNWRYVRELFVVDDGSKDGTRQWLEDQASLVPAATRFIRTRLGSPVAAMSLFLDLAKAPFLAKIDNDAMLPAGWLSQSLQVFQLHPELHLLGIEAIAPSHASSEIIRTYTPSSFIGGLGLFRHEAFTGSRPSPENIYYGFTEWQMAQGQNLIRGWLTPALPVFLLDRLPIEPWKSLSETYIKQGWQRPWKGYDPSDTLWHWRWPHMAHSKPHIGGNKSKRFNLAFCGIKRDGFVNISILPFPGAADVDLRHRWPWKDGELDYVRAQDILEHLPDKIQTMNELWRVLTAGGTAEVVIPSTEGSGAWQDPTHVSYWNRSSFLYFEAGNPCCERFAQRYGIRARFRTLAEITVDSADGPQLTFLLEAIKP